MHMEQFLTEMKTRRENIIRDKIDVLDELERLQEQTAKDIDELNDEIDVYTNEINHIKAVVTMVENDTTSAKS